MYEKYFKKLTEECEIRNRSANTARTYSDNIKRFLIDVGKHPDQLLLDDARQYILKKRRQGISAEYCNNINSSLAFFYKHVLHLFWDQEIVPRMKRDYTMPDVLSVEEVERMINTATEVRNKALIALIYSSGLRLNEAARLRPDDIYMSTMQVHVTDTKTHRDRWTILSQTALEYLKDYWYSYNVSRDRLFVSLLAPHMPLKGSGIEIMIRTIARDAGIKKRVYPHLLRHSFATHLLEQGVSIEYIQTLLGHRCPGSTYTYLHIANKTLMGIQSPLDHPKKKRGRPRKTKDGANNE
ncbi:MAG: integrase [Clostridia bacterium]|nr:integrase [Clostridia bacterium]